jgi:hypothetical protein
MIYTGIGARKTPGDILHAMVQVGEFMYNAGHTLRSGGAQGADRAFEIGADRSFGLKRNALEREPPTLKEIYLPASGWNGNNSPLYNVGQDAERVASLFHPAWTKLKPFVRKLMGRNAYQMLGLDLQTKSDFVICWTPGGDTVGGTGQAIRMANYHGIPVLNFGNLSLNEMNARLEVLLEGGS